MLRGHCRAGLPWSRRHRGRATVDTPLPSCSQVHPLSTGLGLLQRVGAVEDGPLSKRAGGVAHGGRRLRRRRTHWTQENQAKNQAKMTSEPLRIPPPISPTSPHTMSSSGPVPADPLGDELAQIEKLDELAEKYGWDKDSKEYLRRLALIQKAGAKALKMAAAPARGGGSGASHPSFGKPLKWVTLKKEKHANKDSARAMLKKEQSGTWVQDGSCPKSKAEGGLPPARVPLCEQGGGRRAVPVAAGRPYERLVAHGPPRL